MGKREKGKAHRLLVLPRRRDPMPVDSQVVRIALPWFLGMGFRLRGMTSKKCTHAYASPAKHMRIQPAGFENHPSLHTHEAIDICKITGKLRSSIETGGGTCPLMPGQPDGARAPAWCQFLRGPGSAAKMVAPHRHDAVRRRRIPQDSMASSSSGRRLREAAMSLVDVAPPSIPRYATQTLPPFAFEPSASSFPSNSVHPR